MSTSLAADTHGTDGARRKRLVVEEGAIEEADDAPLVLARVGVDAAGVSAPGTSQSRFGLARGGVVAGGEFAHVGLVVLA